jgi:hypothetical protein
LFIQLLIRGNFDSIPKKKFSKEFHLQIKMDHVPYANFALITGVSFSCKISDF